MRKKNLIILLEQQNLFVILRFFKKDFPKISVKFKIIDIGSPEYNQKKIMSFFNDFESQLIKIDVNKLNFQPKTIDKNNKTIEQNMASTMALFINHFRS